MNKKNIILFLHKNGKSATDIAKAVEVTPNFVYKILKLDELSRYKNDTANSLYQTPEYKEFRQKVIDRDGNKCIKCGKTGTKFNPLQVDHLKAKSTNISLIYDMSNSRTLCRICHSKVPTTKTYKRLNKKR